MYDLGSMEISLSKMFKGVFIFSMVSIVSGQEALLSCTFFFDFAHGIIFRKLEFSRGDFGFSYFEQNLILGLFSLH